MQQERSYSRNLISKIFTGLIESFCGRDQAHLRSAGGELVRVSASGADSIDCMQPPCYEARIKLVQQK
jgi:hypothetical protein